jgi:hypothetical protein
MVHATTWAPPPPRPTAPCPRHCGARVRTAGNEVLCKPSATFSDIDHFLRRETCGERWGYGDHMSSLKITQNDVKPFEVNYDRLDLMKARGASTAELDQMMALSKLSRGWECVLNPTDFYQVRCVSMHCVASVFWVRGPHTGAAAMGLREGGHVSLLPLRNSTPSMSACAFHARMQCRPLGC